MPHHEHPEAEVVTAALDPHDDVFGRLLGVAIVVTTLAGAVIAFGQAKSVQRHDEAASRSEQWATLGAGVRSRSEAAAQLQIARARLVHRERVRAQQADGKRLFAPGGDARWLAIEARVWSDLAATVSKRSPALADTVGKEFDEMDRRAATAFPNVDPRDDRQAECHQRSAGTPRSPPALPVGADPDSDPTLTASYLADSRRESYRFDALRQGATHEAEAAEKQFTRYAVSLA